MSGALLVLGAQGQLGGELVAAGRLAGIETRGFGRAELDIRDAGALAAAITAPVTVVNCAAYTAVDRAEGEIEHAMRVNAEAPGLIARRCAEVGARLLHISTDYVFDGSGGDAWREDAPVAPLGVYGRSKAEGERAVRRALDHHVILRVSWVFGARGANFVRTMLRLAEGGREIRVVDDAIGAPTPAAAIAEALLVIHRAAAAPGFDGWGTYHFAGTPDTSWFGFARRILADRPDVVLTPIRSRDFATAAPRPANCRLDCRRIAERFGISRPDWAAALPRVIAAQRATLRDGAAA